MIEEKNKKTFLLGDCREIIRKLIFMIIGNSLCSLAINVFYVPNGLLSTGVGGISIMLNYIFGIPIAIMVLLINIPLLLIGFKKLDKKFMIYTTGSIFIYSYLLDLLLPLANIFIVKDRFIGSIFGALFNGLGMGILFRNDVSQGGFDILASILKKKYNINIGTGLTIFNTVIISLSALKFGAMRAMYTLIAMYLSYQILDRIQTGFKVMKNIIVISDKSLEMANMIMNDMGRGVTFIDGQGAYTSMDKRIIYCTLTSPEIVQLKEIVEEVDPGAFFTITEATEVLGSGFQKFTIDE